MVKEISKWLKRTFFINSIVSLVFGVFLFFLVEVYLRWLGKSFQPPFAIGGFFGGALLAFASASFLAWQQTEWEKVKIVVIVNIVWNLLGTYIFFFNVIVGLTLYGLLPHPMNLIHLIIFFGFLVAFIFFYIQHEKERVVSN
ncbi:MAG: hypothetical protein ACFE9N_10935 [Promethearchaeota archaeon]